MIPRRWCTSRPRTRGASPFGGRQERRATGISQCVANSPADGLDPQGDEVACRDLDGAEADRAGQGKLALRCRHADDSHGVAEPSASSSASACARLWAMSATSLRSRRPGAGGVPPSAACRGARPPPDRAASRSRETARRADTCRRRTDRSARRNRGCRRGRSGRRFRRTHEGPPEAEPVAYARVDSLGRGQPSDTRRKAS